MPYRLSLASNAVSDVIGSAYRGRYGITIPEWRLITVLAEGGGQRLTPVEIGSRTLMDKVTVSRAALGLLKRKLIAKTAHPDDKRSHHLSLTKLGAALYGKVTPQVLRLEEEVLGEFSEAERRVFLSMLIRLENAAKNLRDD